MIQDFPCRCPSGSSGVCKSAGRPLTPANEAAAATNQVSNIGLGRTTEMSASERACLAHSNNRGASSFGHAFSASINTNTTLRGPSESAGPSLILTASTAFLRPSSFSKFPWGCRKRAIDFDPFSTKDFHPNSLEQDSDCLVFAMPFDDQTDVKRHDYISAA